MQILFIAADLPWPPDGGGRIATLRVLESMADGRAVDLVALADPDGEPQLGDLRSLCRSVRYVRHPFTFGRHPIRQAATAGRALLGPTPYRLLKFRSAALEAQVGAMKKEVRYDLIHHDQLGVARYHDQDFPSTLTTQNIEYAIYARGRSSARGLTRRAWSAVEQRKLRRAEPSLYRRFDHVFALTAQDRDDLLTVGARASVFPIPVDISASPPRRAPAAPTLLTLGSMSWFGVEDGLLWFAEQVFPLIREQVPDVVWNLVGANAGRRIRDLDDGHAIRLVGYLPDVKPMIDASRVVVVPLHIAGGVRIKLIELLASGRPAVATSIGAEGLDFEDGAGCFRRDDPVSFASAVANLLRDDQMWQDASRAGLDYARQGHSRAGARAAVEEGIADAIEHHARAAAIR